MINYNALSAEAENNPGQIDIPLRSINPNDTNIYIV